MTGCDPELSGGVATHPPPKEPIRIYPDATTTTTPTDDPSQIRAPQQVKHGWTRTVHPFSVVGNDE
jgi:hypothetical protein